MSFILIYFMTVGNIYNILNMGVHFAPPIMHKSSLKHKRKKIVDCFVILYVWHLMYAKNLTEHGSSNSSLMTHGYIGIFFMWHMC